MTDDDDQLVHLSASYALLDAARRIDERARGVGRIIHNPDQRPLCASREHDDRWCQACDLMGAGMNAAAELLREMADDVDD